MSKKLLYLELYEANIELELSINRLLGKRVGLKPAQAESDSANLPAACQEHGCPDDWCFVVGAALPGAVLLRLLQHQVVNDEILNKITVKNQVAFVIELRQALEAWHQRVTEIMGDVEVGQPVLDALKPWAVKPDER